MMSEKTDSRKENLSVLLLISALIVGLVIAILVPPLFSQPTQGTGTMDEAVKTARDFLALTNDNNLAIGQVVEFRNDFYVTYYEKSTGIGAFEMLVNKPGTDAIMPEPGPNMMWNTKYGQMMGWTIGDVLTGATITADQAKAYAQGYVDAHLPGAKVIDDRPFYGYYTVDIGMNGKMYGMLSVNAYTGQIWYHFWHGEYITTRSFV